MAQWDTQLRKGLAELAILALLARKVEDYGYSITESLKGLDGLSLSESTVYPILTRLAGEGLVSIRTASSPTGPTRRYYRLTESGKSRLAQLAKSWRTVSRSLTATLEGVE